MEEWAYKAEGNAHIVLKYIGSRPGHIGTVLRIKKTGLGKTDEQKAPKNKNDRIDHAEYHELLRRLLGRQLVFPMAPVSLGKDTLEHISRQIQESRPHHRLKKAIDIQFPTVHQTVDASHSADLKDLYSVEFKPKWGFLPSSQFISKESQIKKKICRFCMYKDLRFKGSTAEHLKNYCPIDLFSHDMNRISHAASQLFELDPPFFKSYKNGEYYTLSADEKDSLLEQFSGVLYENGVLEHLGKLQQNFDKHDIEHIKGIYDSNPELDLDINDFEKVVKEFELCKNEIIDDTASTKIAKFLISTTLKDVSIIITFCRDNPDSTKSQDDKNNITKGYDFPSWEKYSIGPNQTFYARIAIIDLDPKKQSKIPEYFEKDQRIVESFKAKQER